MEPISWPELGQTSRARVLRALCEAGGAGMNGPDIRRGTDHGDYRKRICELLTEDEIPVDRARVPGRNWKRYTLKVSPGEAIRRFMEKHPIAGRVKRLVNALTREAHESYAELVMSEPGSGLIATHGETKDTASGGGSDVKALLNAKQGVVEEARAVQTAAQVLGKRSAAVRANRANAPHTAPGGLTWSEYRVKKKEDQLCLT
jgi:hypothetical protein